MAAMSCCVWMGLVSIVWGQGVRRNIVDWSAEEKLTLLETLYVMKQSPSRWNSSWSAYDYYVQIHRIAFGPEQYGHLRWSFLPWHRAYLQLFEEDVRLHYVGPDAENFYLPYWDPTSDESIQATLYDTDFLGGDGNPLLGWGNNNQSSLSCSRWPIDDRLLPIIITYNHSCLSRTIGQGRLVVTPNGTNYTYAENLPSYNKWFDPIYEERLPYDVHPYFTPNFSREDITRSFRATIEGADPILLTGNFTHGSLHNYIGGHVIEDTSPNDPLFFLLHGWIDLMWALYQDQWGDWAFYTFPQQYLDSPYFQMGNDLQIFNNSQYTTRDVMDHRNSLGYRYDVQPVDTDIADTVESWWDTLRESPWYELWIALVALLVGLVLGCCVMKCCRSRMIAKRYSEKDEFDQLLT